MVLVSGCQIYFGGTGDDDDCYAVDGRSAVADPGGGYLNPSTLACEFTGGGGGCGSNDFRPAASDWALCYTTCSGMTEGQCVQSDGCRAIYKQYEVFDPDAWIPVFDVCAATAPSGPVRGGGCDGLDAYECSRHDDCAAVRDPMSGSFAGCQAETWVCPDVPVRPPLRNPASGKCESPGGNPCDPAVPPPTLVPDWGACDSPCAGLDETTCRAADACRAIYADASPPWTEQAPHFVYKDCWPTAPSGPVHGGGCQGLDAYGCSRHDDCVAHHDADWSACMNDATCPWTVGEFRSCEDESTPPPPPPACPTLGEAACIARTDCTPLYRGEDCDCTPMGCTCSTWTFDACQAGP
jgi:hypothetical protein